MNMKTTTKNIFMSMLTAALIMLAFFIIYEQGNDTVACEVSVLTVEQGDTYWSMTGKANCVGGYDKQDRVGQIIDLNKDVDLYPGLVIVFPTK